MYNRKKQLFISAMKIIGILLIALISTYYIYQNFQKERNVDFTSDSLSITFHEKSGDNINLTKITPVTDAVGLSSKAYTFTVKNNLTIDNNYQIKLVDNTNKINEDMCSNNLIDKSIIKVSIKCKKETKTYMLNELVNNTLLEENIKPLEEKEYTIRVWTISTATPSSNMHYHGQIQIVEDGKVAVVE